MAIVELPVQGAQPIPASTIRKIAIEEHILSPLLTPHEYAEHAVRHLGVGAEWGRREPGASSGVRLPSLLGCESPHR
jgi:hypothetical protein